MTTNDTRLCGMLGFAMRAGKLVSGTEQVCLAMAKSGSKKPRLILICRNASAATVKKLTVKATYYHIPSRILPMEADDLGARLGKAHAPMCIAVTDDGFAREIALALGTEIQ